MGPVLWRALRASSQHSDRCELLHIQVAVSSMHSIYRLDVMCCCAAHHLAATV